MKSFIDWLVARLAENSTWRGIILTLTAAGIVLDDKQAMAITAAGLAAVGLINVFRKAPGSSDATPTPPKP